MRRLIHIFKSCFWRGRPVPVSLVVCCFVIFLTNCTAGILTGGDNATRSDLRSDVISTLSEKEHQLLTEQTSEAFSAFLYHLEERSELTQAEYEKTVSMLDMWPDEKRQVPERWIDRISEGEDVKFGELTRALNLSDRDWKSDELEQFLERPETIRLLGYITVLDLSENPFGGDGAQILAEQLGGLNHYITNFNFKATNIRDSGLVHLLDAGLFDRAEKLRLGHNNFRDGLVELFTASAITELRHLGLETVRMRQRDVEVLAESSVLEGLVSLNLRGSRIRDEGADFLLSSAGMGSVRRLDLRDNLISEKGLERLMEFEHLSGLEALKIGGRNSIGSEGLQLVAQSPMAEELRVLDVSSSGIDEEGVERMVGEKSRLENLTTLSLRYNNLGENGVDLLGRGPFKDSLIFLDLKCTGTTDEAINGLFDSGAFSNLRSLNLMGDLDRGFTSNALMRLAQAGVLDELREIKLTGHGIGDEGIMQVVNSNNPQSFRNITIQGANVSEEGAISIAENKGLENLEVLDLRWNVISAKGVELIDSSSHLPEQLEIRLAGQRSDMEDPIERRVRELAEESSSIHGNDTYCIGRWRTRR